jgi:hypothetical protein
MLNVKTAEEHIPIILVNLFMNAMLGLVGLWRGLRRYAFSLLRQIAVETGM